MTWKWPGPELDNIFVLEVMTSMDFQILPYLYVTNSFLLEICFWGSTILPLVTMSLNFTLFLKASLTVETSSLILALAFSTTVSQLPRHYLEHPWVE